MGPRLHNQVEGCAPHWAQNIGVGKPPLEKPSPQKGGFWYPPRGANIPPGGKCVSPKEREESAKP